MESLNRAFNRCSRRLSSPYPTSSLGDLVRPIILVSDTDGEGNNPVLAQQPGPGIPMGGARRALLMISLLIGLMISCIDTSIVSTALLQMSTDLGDFQNAPWIVLAYLLIYMGWAPFLAKLSDIYGRRNMVIFSWSSFIGFSLACGSSQTTYEMIIFRAFQGLGGSGLYTLAQICIVEIGPIRQPGLVGGMIGATLSMSFVLGPILGGVITTLATWRWIFLINIPVGLVTVLALVIAWPPEDNEQEVFALATIKKIDYLGGLSIFFASTFLVFAVQEAGSEAFAWNSNEIIISLAVSFVSFVVFLIWEIQLARNYPTRTLPLFPIRLMVKRVYLSSYIVTFITGFINLALVITIPERFQIVNGHDSLGAGIDLLPLLGACAVGSFAAGAICSKRNNTSPALMVSACLQIIGIGLMSTIKEIDSDIKAQYGYQSVIGLGVGLSFGAATIISSVEGAKYRELAAAQGAIAQVRVLGGCLGVAICTIIFNGNANKNLQGRIPQETLDNFHRSPLGAFSTLQQDPNYLTLVNLIREVYARSFAFEAKVMIFLCAVMVVFAFLTWESHPISLAEALGHQDVGEIENTDNAGIGDGNPGSRRSQENRERHRRGFRANKEAPPSSQEGQSDTELSDMNSVQST